MSYTDQEISITLAALREHLGNYPLFNIDLSEENMENKQKSTGFKDANDVEIREGDVLQPKGFNGFYGGIVKWKDDHWNLPRPLDCWEILGNIHENPELIEQTNEFLTKLEKLGVPKEKVI